MKQLIYCMVFGLAVSISVSLCASERVVDLANSVKTVSIVDADSTGVKEGMSRVKITDAIRGTKFDAVLVNYLVSAFLDSVGGTSGGLGNIDTAIIITYSGQDWIENVLSCDTCTSLPCSVEVYYAEDVPGEGDTSGVGIWLFNGDEKQFGLMYDQIWFDYHMADSGGTGGTRSATIQYRIRGFEEE